MTSTGCTRLDCDCPSQHIKGIRLGDLPVHIYRDRRHSMARNQSP